MSKINLVELNRSHLKKINEWRNDSSTIDCLGANFRYIDIEVDGIWYEHYLKNREKYVRLAIFYDDVHVGMINLIDIHPVNKSAELSMFIGESEFRGKGIGFQVLQFMLRHAFSDLNLNRVYLYANTDNQTANNLYEKIGFKKEGVLAQAVFKNGKYIDVNLYGILRSDYTEE